MRDYFRRENPIHFIFPIDGDCLNDNDRTADRDAFTIKVKVYAARDAELFINEKKAVYNGNCFEADIPLIGYRNTLEAVDKRAEGAGESIAVYRLDQAAGKYRISIDDVIFAMQDLTVHKDTYQSVFDNPFLKVFKEAHDRYGLKISLNLFYETDEMTDFSKKHDYFNLSMMTDAYKEEWKANADWLLFTFHARKEHPDYPYRNTTAENIRTDCELVHREILRFAGKECLADVATLHWSTTNEIGARTLRALGYKGMLGFFILDANKEPYVSYFYPADLTEHIGSRDFWKDNAEDMICVRIDLVLNELRSHNLEERLEEVVRHPGRGGFLEMVIHEQYFYEDYREYISEYGDLILNTCKFLSSRNYKPVFLREVMFENA